MNQNGRIKKVFPGGNTSKGFYSYYDQIIDSKATKLWIIKGGPGVGKSSFMRKIGYEIAQNGYDVEFHQCSSDYDSLDGIMIPDLKMAMIDGTSPHVVDPKYPGAVDEILNFGQFWNELGIQKHKESIIRISKETSKCFQRAYKFFAAAKLIRDDMNAIYEEALERRKLDQKLVTLKKELFHHLDYNEEGKIRHLFGSAFTPKGYVDYYDTILEGIQTIYYVDGTYIDTMSQLIEKIAYEGMSRGLNVEVYHEPLDEKNIQTLIIPLLQVGITTSDRYAHSCNQKIVFSDFLKRDILSLYEDLLKEDRKFYEELIDTGIFNIKKAKEKHDQLEKIYIEYMDFKKIDELRENILQKILKYAKVK
ncbi:hypothetical protein [Inediibacterium massiliense]|uniref:hypothetical protein n=1 Tax=Inediibacterium massiliense TaxID=1658111 RepID=UPI0006B40AC1|nr:hypothetical protein [Inediibacterium massiliense]